MDWILENFYLLKQDFAFNKTMLYFTGRLIILFTIIVVIL